MLGVSHHHAVKVLCDTQADMILVVLRQRADVIAATHSVSNMILFSDTTGCHSNNCFCNVFWPLRALIVLVGRQDGRLSCRKSSAAVHKYLLIYLETQPNLRWIISGSSSVVSVIRIMQWFVVKSEEYAVIMIVVS